MRQETAFSSALKKAGVDTDSAMLYSIAQDVLRRNGVNAMRSLDEFMEELSDAGGLWSALLLKEEKRSAGLRYLNSVARDMRGKFDEAAVRGSGDRQNWDGPASSKSVSPQGDGAAQTTGESQRSIGRSENPSESWPGESKDTMGANLTVAPPKNANDGAVHRTFDSHIGRGRPSFAPAKTTRFDRLKKVKEALPPSIFDTMLLRDGTPIGELRWSQLDRFIAANVREAEILRLVKNHAIPADPNAKVRDVVKLDVMQKIMQKAAEIVDA